VRVVLERAVFRVVHDVEVLELGPAAGLEVPVWVGWVVSVGPWSRVKGVGWLTYSYTDPKSPGQSLMHAIMYRQKIKSKGVRYTHGHSTSSTSNLTFGGTHGGWMGLRSFPRICATG
jgi:hypothetical protein